MKFLQWLKMVLWRFRAQGVHYIGGSDVLPPPLSPEEEAAAVEEDMMVTLEVCYGFYLRGFQFEDIDLYRSDATKFLMDGEKGTLLPPFTAIPGLGETAAISIVENRVGRTFISQEELLAACPKVSKTHVEQLRDAGALGTLPETSQMSLFG